MFKEYMTNLSGGITVGIIAGVVVIISGILSIIRKDQPPKPQKWNPFWFDATSDWKPQDRRIYNLIGGIVSIVFGLFLLIYCIVLIVKNP